MTCPNSRYGKPGEQGIWGGMHVFDSTNVCQDCGMASQAAEDYPAHAALERGNKNHYLALREEFQVLLIDNASLRAVMGELVGALEAVISTKWVVEGSGAAPAYLDKIIAKQIQQALSRANQNRGSK